jgi:hypothetical protein
MACSLTTSISLACKDSIGGIKKIYVTELENKNTLSSTTGNVTTFTLSTGKQFWTYDFTKETGEFTEKINTSDENGSLFYEGELKIRLNKRDVTKRNELHLLAQNRLMIIVLDRNGVYWLLGQNNGCDFMPSQSMTGKAMGDFNGYELVFGYKEEVAAMTVNSALISTLTAPAA